MGLLGAMETTSVSPRVAEALRSRRAARRLNGYSLVLLVAFLALGLTNVIGSTKLWMALFFATLTVHFVAALRMAFRACPGCGRPFAKISLLSLVPSLEEEMTIQCQNCGLRIDADTKQ